MPARPSKEDVLNAYRRAALMDAARRVFGRHGFEQATMEAIAREAGVAKGTIYLYYPSKQAIYEATFAACMAELEQRTRVRVEAAATPRDAIAAFVATRAEYFQDTHDFFRMYVAEIGRQVAGTSGWQGIKTLVGRQTRVLQHVLARAVETGEIRPVDPAATALAIFDMTRGLVSRRLVAHQRGDVRREAGFLTDLIWTGLAPEGRRTR